MGDFGDEFTNAKPDVASGPTPEVVPGPAILPAPGLDAARERAVAERNARRLQTLANLLAIEGGGYLYLPPGRYYLGRSSVRPVGRIVSEEKADLVIPQEVTLWFAPAAVLVPLAGLEWTSPLTIPGIPAADPETLAVRLEIQGDIVAGVEPIFDAQFEQFDLLGSFPARTTVTSLPAGRVFLTSNRIRQVYPEWWGALPRRPLPRDPRSPNLFDETFHGVARTARAFQAAIDAAYTRRTTPKRTSNGGIESPRAWNVRPSIPIVAPSTYVINRQLDVLAPSDPRVFPWFGGPALPGGGFELRGDRGVGSVGLGEPTLAASTYPSSLFSPTDALLHIDGPEQVRVDGVTFDGELLASGALSIIPASREWLTHTFEACTFRNCIGTLITLDASRARGPRRDFWNASFTRCRFEPGDVDKVSERINTRVQGAFEIADAEGNLVAVDLTLDDNGGLVFQNCVFFGCASPAIRARSGRFTLNESVFHVSRPAHPGLAMRHRDVDFRHGMDIFIEGERGSNQGDRYVPATFTAREVESQSWQFLGTARPASGAREQANRSAVVLLNVTASPVSNFPAEPDTRHEWLPPSLYWDQPGNLGCPLVMMGCRVNGLGPDPARPTDPTLYRTLVIIGPNMTGDIFTVGCGTLFPLAPARSVFVMSNFDPTQPLRPPPILPRVRRLTATALPVSP